MSRFRYKWQLEPKSLTRTQEFFAALLSAKLGPKELKSRLKESCAMLGGSARVCCYLDIVSIWEFPKIGGTLFWGSYNRDPIV